MITEGKINSKQDFREYFLGNFLFLSSKKKKKGKYFLGYINRSSGRKRGRRANPR